MALLAKYGDESARAILGRTPEPDDALARGGTQAGRWRYTVAKII